MDPISFLQQYVFYTPEQKKAINTQAAAAASLNQYGPSSEAAELTPAQLNNRRARMSLEAMTPESERLKEIPKPSLFTNFAGQQTKNKPPKQPSGSITSAFGTQYDMSDPAQVAALNREIEEHKRKRLQTIDQKIAKSEVEPETSLPPNPPSEPADGAAKLDPNATKEFKTAFGAGEKNMDDMRNYFGSQNNGENLKKWAKANPALAFKEYKKAGMAGKEPFGYNDVEFGKLESNPAEAAKKVDIEKLYEGQVEQTEQEKAAQAFKNFYVDGLKGLNVGQYKDMDANSSSVDPSSLLEKSVDFNIPGLAGTLGNYGTADYGELLKQYPNIFSNK